MESNTTEPEFLNPEPALTEPHFDEEATVLSARPVVPLEEIRTNTRPRRPWVFGLAVAAALLLGVTATAFYFSQQRVNNPTALADSDSVVSGVQGVVTENEVADNFQPNQPKVNAVTPAPAANESRVEVRPMNLPSAPAPRSSKKPVARLVEVITSDPRSYSEKRIHEERKAARQEEKQRRREARREMRDDKSPDDLLRIREIFEGRRKP